MDNGNKIEKISPDIFLPDEYKLEETKPELYNLEEEFIKTRKNRDILPFLFFFFFIGVISFLSFFLIYYIQNKNKKMSIDIEDFQDLNLLEILNTVKGYEKDLIDLKDEVAELEKTRDLLLKDVKEDITKKINFLKHKRMNQTDKNKRIAELREEEKARLKKINEEYNDKIAIKKQKVDEISLKLKSFEESTLRSIKEIDIATDENSDIHDLEIKKISEKYEKRLREETDYYKNKLERTENYYKNLTETLILKYNPIIDDPQIKKLIESDIDENLKIEFKIGVNDIIISDKKIIEDLRKNQDNLVLLEKQFEEIPYENSIPLLLKKIFYLEKKIINIYEEIVYILLTQKQNLEKENESNLKEIERYHNAFIYLVNKNPEYGYIIDSSNPNDVIFIKNENKIINSGDKKAILRDGTEIGTIEFYMDNNNLKAKIIYIKEKQNILPFDIIELK